MGKHERKKPVSVLNGFTKKVVGSIPTRPYAIYETRKEYAEKWLKSFFLLSEISYKWGEAVYLSTVSLPRKGYKAYIFFVIFTTFIIERRYPIW